MGVGQVVERVEAMEYHVGVVGSREDEVQELAWMMR